MMIHAQAAGAAFFFYLAQQVSATPAPTAIHAVHQPRAPLVTPSPSISDVSQALERRNIISDIAADLTKGYNYVASELGTNLPSFVVSGIPAWYSGLPTGDKVQSSLGIDDDQVRALPTQVLNLPPYAYWTDAGWNVRFHGNVYKQPNTSREKLDDLSNVFLIGTDIDQLNATEQDMTRNVTAAIFVIQQGNVNVSTIDLQPSTNQSGGVPAAGGAQSVTLPYETTDEGDFDVFVPIKSNGLLAGNATNTIQKLDVHVENATLGNATAYLVPPTGLTVVSDIDDILRITKIYQPKEGILNSFSRPYVPWENMPDIYSNWDKTIQNVHFHYLTTLPEQVTRNYMDFIYKTYPMGSFDTRPLNFSDISATLSIRKYLLDKIFATFPQRKFVLVGDVSNSDIMRDYPQLAVDHPDQVACIFLRNTTATDDDKFPYDTKGFKTIPQHKYMFFVHANDLTGLDIANGNCYNRSIAQNLTFSTQNLPLGLSKLGAVNGSANNNTGAASSLRGNGGGSAYLAFSSAALIGLAFCIL